MPGADAAEHLYEEVAKIVNKLLEADCDLAKICRTHGGCFSFVSTKPYKVGGILYYIAGFLYTDLNKHLLKKKN